MNIYLNVYFFNLDWTSLLYGIINKYINSIWYDQYYLTWCIRLIKFYWIVWPLSLQGWNHWATLWVHPPPHTPKLVSCWISFLVYCIVYYTYACIMIYLVFAILLQSFRKTRLNFWFSKTYDCDFRNSVVSDTFVNTFEWWRHSKRTKYGHVSMCSCS